MFVYFLIRRPYEKSNKSNKIVHDQKDKVEKTTLVLVSVGMMLLPLTFIFTDLLSFADYSLPLGLHITGVTIMIISAWLFYRSHKDLGKNWSVTLEIREEHKLISSGVYSKIRHPMYTAIWLWVIGQAFLLNNFIAGLSGIVFFGLLYFLRVGQEEKMMEANFGDQYIQYKSQTGRLIPKF